MMNNMNYRLIVIENSLKDKRILTQYKTLATTKFEEGTPEESLMYKIQIPEKETHKVANELMNNLKYPYYAHLYHEDPKKSQMIVIFEKKVFNVSKDDFDRAFQYGINHDISKEQMTPFPRDVSQENW